MLNPFALSVEPMAGMLNFEIADDPTYSGLEIQAFDDDHHGSGVVVLLNRRADRRVDVYRQPGLRLDPAGYGIAAGLGEWREAAMDPARLEITPFGVSADLEMDDADGRRVVVHIDDTDRRRRAPAALLAPFGAAIEQPTAMLLVWMPRFDLVRTSGRAPDIRIADRAATIGRLPGARLHGRRLIKYAADLAVVRLNGEQAGPVPALDPEAPGAARLVSDGGHLRLAAVVATGGRHRVRLELDPALPDIAVLPDGREVSGTWRLGIDDAPSVVSGTWRVRRVWDEARVELDSTAKWRPGPLPLLMRIVTTIVPTFRSWPLTYRWRATVALGPEPTIAARWERTTDARDESYGRLMGVSSG